MVQSVPHTAITHPSHRGQRGGSRHQGHEIPVTTQDSKSSKLSGCGCQSGHHSRARTAQVGRFQTSLGYRKENTTKNCWHSVGMATQCSRAGGGWIACLAYVKSWATSPEPHISGVMMTTCVHLPINYSTQEVRKDELESKVTFLTWEL